MCSKIWDWIQVNCVSSFFHHQLFLFKRGGNIVVPKDPKRITKSFDDDDENDDEDDVEELERKIR